MIYILFLIGKKVWLYIRRNSIEEKNHAGNTTWGSEIFNI